MEFPKEVKIGWVKLKVSFDEGLTLKRELLSTSHVDMEHIQVAGTLPDDVKCEMIWRGIHNSIGNITRPEIEDGQRFALATGIMNVLKHNCALLSPEKISGIEALDLFGWQWKIIRKPAHFEGNGRENNTDKTLFLNGGLPLTQQFHTLWHEIYHVMYNALGLTEYETERDVDLYAFFLAGVIKENDLSWLAGEGGFNGEG